MIALSIMVQPGQPRIRSHRTATLAHGRKGALGLSLIISCPEAMGTVTAVVISKVSLLKRSSLIISMRSQSVAPRGGRRRLSFRGGSL